MPTVERMVDTTVLVMGCTVITPWGRDQIRRLSEQARRRGVALLGADTPANLAAASPDELTRMDELIALDVHDPNACLAWAGSRSDIDAVLTIRELAVYATAVLARELGVPGNDPVSVDLIRNKDLCRERLRQNGFPQPATALCDGPADAERFMREHAPGPWIVKPRDGLASIGVSKVHGTEDMPAALNRFGTPPTAMGSLPGQHRFLIETFVDGEEFSAEGVVIDGVPRVLALTRKEITENFLEISHRVPADLDEPTARAACDAVSGAVTAAGITRGIFHVEFWTTESGIVLGELHDRPGGDWIHALVEHTRPGLELYGVLVDDLLGRPIQPIPESAGAARAEFLISTPGRLRAVPGWEDVTSNPDVIAAHIEVAPGDTVEPTTDAFGRHGMFVVGADSPDKADRLADDLRSRVVFEVD